MHHSFSLLSTITMGIIMAFICGYIARKLKLPSIVGYLIAGLMIGPFTPGFVGDLEAANQLAEMGVIFMMFGVGLHFSLQDLWSVRRIAIPGAILQMFFATLCGLAVSQLWGWSIDAGLVLGLAISIASTVVLLRNLSDNGLLNTNHGKVVVGWLVLEDLATVAILVLLPALVSTGDNPLASIGLAILKTVVFVVIMLFAGTRFMPWLLTQIAHTRSRELFILAVVALALGTALVAYELFGVSLALGAFLAGVVVSESDVSHQVGAELIPFRDIFAVLFFVSVGMLVDPSVVWENIDQVIILTVLIVGGKALITLLMGIVLPASPQTLVVVAAGLSQIGEFSFIVGQSGVYLGLLSQDQYGLILAGALLSIIINPLMFRAMPTMENSLRHVPFLWQQLEKHGNMPLPIHHKMTDHVVIVGYGRVGRHIGRVLKQLEIPYLVIELDAAYASSIQQEGTQTLFGDASNSEILIHAELDYARALVVTVPNQTTAELVVAAAHDIAPLLPIIARASADTGVKRLVGLGANHVIHPELEGGLEIVRHALLTLSYPMNQIQSYVDAVRRDAYEATQHDDATISDMDKLLTAIRGVEIAWQPIEAGSSIVGKTLAESNIRAQVGASVVALVRNQEVIPNPKSDVILVQGDLLGLIGNPQELASATRLLSNTISD